MKIILLKDVAGKGKKDDIIDVKKGYGNNYLIRNKLGVLYTEGSKKILDQELNKRKDKEIKQIDKCKEIKNKINNIDITFKVKVGKDDKVFGNISTKQISDELLKKGFKIDKKNIKTNGNLDTLGIHKVLVELHKEVNCFINVILIK